VRIHAVSEGVVAFAFRHDRVDPHHPIGWGEIRSRGKPRRRR
jgi:hypothetical protein